MRPGQRVGAGVLRPLDKGNLAALLRPCDLRRGPTRPCGLLKSTFDAFGAAQGAATMAPEHEMEAS
jgi:hypothetical protein